MDINDYIVGEEPRTTDLTNAMPSDDPVFNHNGREAHPHYTVTLRELIDAGVPQVSPKDWVLTNLNEFVVKTLYKRLVDFKVVDKEDFDSWILLRDMIVEHLEVAYRLAFDFNEIGQPEILEWKTRIQGTYLNAFSEFVNALISSLMVWFVNSGQSGRERIVHSEYPQNQIQGSNDYADNANDRQWDYDNKNIIPPNLTDILGNPEITENFINRLRKHFMLLWK